MSDSVLHRERALGRVQVDIQIRSTDNMKPFFTFTDLPGLISAAGNGQATSDIDAIEQLAIEHIQVLVVLEANRDLQLDRVLNVVDQHVPDVTKRAIGIVSKMNTIEHKKKKQERAADLHTTGL